MEARKGTRRNAEEEQGLYIISVAAKLLDMHPQTLRKYERVGFINPPRTIGMLRLYTAEDIVRLRLIKHLVDDRGLNLTGVDMILDLVSYILHMRQILALAHEEEDLHHNLRAIVNDMLATIGVSGPPVI